MTTSPAARDGRHCTACGAPLDGTTGPLVCAACARRPAALAETLIAGSNAPAGPAPAAPASTTAATLGAGVAGPGAGAASATGAGKSFGRYRILARLGTGGMGVVWKAHDTQLDRTVALKLIREEALGDPLLLERFLREARLAAKLRHPHVVAVHDVGEIDGRAFLSMDLVAGRTLAQRLDETRPRLRTGEAPDPARLRADIALLADVAAAVAAAHAAGIVHRDLKPGNVLLDEGPAACPYVTDFGLAKEVSAAGDHHDLTVAGTALGTPHYMSPEQAKGRVQDMGPAADVWSLGVMLYEILTGRTPFEDAPTPWAVLGAVVEKEPKPPRACNPHVPPALEAVCLKTLRKAPSERYPDAAAFEQELRRWLANAPVAAAAAAPSPPRRRRGRRAVAVAAGVLLLMVGVAVVAGGKMWREAARLRPLARLRLEANACLAEARGPRTAADTQFAVRLRARLAEAARRTQAELERPSPEPDFHAGRLARALQDGAAAAEDQDRALRVDPDFAPALYERTLLAAHEYVEAYEHARASGVAVELRVPAGPPGAAGLPTDDPPADDVERRSETLAHLRGFADRLGAHLRTVLARAPQNAPAAAVGAPQVSAAQASVLEAALVLTRPGGNWESARALLVAALADETAVDDAGATLYPEAVVLGETQLIIDAATRGIEAHPGNARHWRFRGVARQMVGNGLKVKGQDPAEPYRAAMRDLDEAIRLHPWVTEAWLDRAQTRRGLAEWLDRGGADAAASLRAAIEDYDRALALESRSAPAYAGRGRTRMLLAAGQRRAGNDPTALLEAARADLEEAVQRAPGDPTIRAWREELGAMRK